MDITTIASISKFCAVLVTRRERARERERDERRDDRSQAEWTSELYCECAPAMAATDNDDDDDEEFSVNDEPTMCYTVKCCRLIAACLLFHCLSMRKIGNVASLDITHTCDACTHSACNETWQQNTIYRAPNKKTRRRRRNGSKCLVRKRVRATVAVKERIRLRISHGIDFVHHFSAPIFVSVLPPRRGEYSNRIWIMDVIHIYRVTVHLAAATFIISYLTPL